MQSQEDLADVQEFIMLNDCSNIMYVGIGQR